jgi:hypothetical protein
MGMNMYALLNVLMLLFIISSISSFPVMNSNLPIALILRKNTIYHSYLIRSAHTSFHDFYLSPYRFGPEVLI